MRPMPAVGEPTLLSNLLSPIVLAFALGAFASLIRSDLRIPDALYESLSIYLLLAIGLKGGVALATADPSAILLPALAALLLGATIPIVAFGVLRGLGRFGGLRDLHHLGLDDRPGLDDRGLGVHHPLGGALPGLLLLHQHLVKKILLFH